MMLGPCVGYILQTMTMVQTGQAEGFSPFVSFILIVSNLIRVFWWYAERFSLVIFFAAIIMIICQLALLFMWVKIMNKPKQSQGKFSEAVYSTMSKNESFFLLPKSYSSSLPIFGFFAFLQTRRNSWRVSGTGKTS